MERKLPGGGDPEEVWETGRPPIDGGPEEDSELGKRLIEEEQEDVHQKDYNPNKILQRRQNVDGKLK